MTELDWLPGSSAILAAGATIVGAVTLVLFFARGGRWGLINDVASIVLMLAMVPVALGIASLSRVEWRYGAALVGIVGMLGASTAQALLVARRYSYERLLPWTLGFGAVVGAWYILIGLAGVRPGSRFFPDGPVRLDTLAIVAGISFIALGFGWLRGSERHPVSIAAGVVLLVASTWFLTWVGLLFISGDIHAV